MELTRCPLAASRRRGRSRNRKPGDRRQKLLERDEARRIAVNAWKHEMVPGAGAVSMDDHPDAADNPLDQTEQELLISTVSDEALEKAACGTSWAQTYPQTCVATICVGDSSFPKKLNGQIPNAR